MFSHSVLTLCDPKNCSTPGLPVHHHLPECAPTHVHSVGDVIQPSHPLLSPSPAFNLAQHQDLFQCVSSSYQVATVLDFSFNISPSNEYSGLIPSGLTCLISLHFKGLSRVFSSITVQKHQLFGAQHFFIVQLSHPYMTTGKTIALTRQTFVGKVMSLLFI